jgi:2,4-dienoyl-CoA reductase (NADPH2)
MGDLGTTREEVVEFSKIFEVAGADAFHVRSYQYGNLLSIYVEQYFYPEKRDDLPSGMDFSRRGPGAFTPDCHAIKQAVSKPVFTPGKWEWELEYAEECIRKGKIDAIGMTRGLNADPELPKKLEEGRLEDIRPCTACFSCFEGHQFPEPTYTYCRINPFMGKELEYETYPPAKKKKRVLIAGGGPAGMEAARTASLRGHEVTLYSSDSFLGGLMPMAAMIKGDYPENIENIIKWYRFQLKKLGVKTVLGKRVTPETVTKMTPDAVVVATGAASSDRVIPGWDNKKVVSSDSLRSRINKALKFSRPAHLSKATKLWVPVGRKVVIMGGDIKGLQLAEFLIKRGRSVTVVEETEMLGQGMNLASFGVLSMWLDKKDVTLMTSVRYEEINDQGLVVTTKDGRKQTIEAESILPMMPLEADRDLAEELEGTVSEVHVCGSCNNPGLIRDAINEGNQVGMAL